MNTRLPPLQTLEAFCVAASDGSFRSAARRLNLTPSAISHQIKNLESSLGVILFERSARSVLLTEVGKTYYKHISQSLEDIKIATRRLHGIDQSTSLTISASPSDAINWLVPKLDEFRRLYPELVIRLESSSEIVDFANSDVDVAIRSLTSRPTGEALLFHHLYDENLVVICGTRMASELKRIEDFCMATRLLSLTSLNAWSVWFELAGLKPFSVSNRIELSNDAAVIEAASHNLGVGIVHEAAAIYALRAGKIAQPFPDTITSPRTCYLVYLKTSAELEQISAFRNWILQLT